MIIYENLLYNQDIAHVTEIKFPWYKLQNRSIMISGATGLIGSFLIDVLLEKNTQDGLNCTVYALGRNKEKAMERFSKHANNSHLIFIPYDVRLPLKIDNVGRVDYVLHLAANTHPMLYATDPIGTITTNLIGAQNMLEFSAQHNAVRFLLASSNEMYGENLKCRLYRSKWVQSITVNDVMESGQVVENPMIGAIPSKNEVQRELDDLLMSM